MLQDSMYPEDWERYYDDKFLDEARRRGYVPKGSYSKPPLGIQEAADRIRDCRSTGCKVDFNDERRIVEWALTLIPR